MLIRRLHGNVFHIVTGESGSGRHFLCLCGARIVKEDISQQLLAEWPYSRCWVCRKLENERFQAVYNHKRL